MNKNVIACEWVYKLKIDSEGNIARYKARLVACGNAEEYWIDYHEVFAPVTRQTTFRTLLARDKKLLIKHYDVKNAFLNGELDKIIYMKQPKEFVVENKENMVCKLKNNIYGLKQTARMWNLKIDRILEVEGYIHTKYDRSISIYKSLCR